MASRFYFSSTRLVAGGITPGFAAWTITTQGDRREMAVAKDGSALDDKSLWDGASPAANASALGRQYISPPMAAGIGFVTTDTIKGVIQARESAANDNVNRQPLCLKVYAADGTTLQATLFALAHVGPTTTEWNTTYQNKQFADGDVLAANYTTVAGDRLVLEIGGQVSSAGGTSVTANLHCGSSSATDLSENETETTANSPWFEISRTVTFLAPQDDSSGFMGSFNAFVGVSQSLAAAGLGLALLAGSVGAGWGGQEELPPQPTAPGDEDPLPVWVAPAPLPVLPGLWTLQQQDELPSQTGPMNSPVRTPMASPVLEPINIPAPWRWATDELPAPPPSALSEDYPAPFRFKMGGGPLVTIHRPGSGYSANVPDAVVGDDTGGFSPTVFMGGGVRIQWPPSGGYSALPPTSSVPGDEGAYLPPPPLPVPVVSAPNYHTDAYPTPPISAPWEDAGFAPMAFLGTATRVQWPPAGGYSAPPPAAPFGLVDGDGEEAVRLTTIRPPQPDPILLLDGTEDYTPLGDEDSYAPPVVVPTLVVRFDPWRFAVDELPTTVQPFSLWDDGLVVRTVLPPTLATFDAWRVIPEELPTYGVTEDAPPAFVVVPVLPTLLPPYWGLPDELPAYGVTEDAPPLFVVLPVAPVLLPPWTQQPDELPTPPVTFSLTDEPWVLPLMALPNQSVVRYEGWLVTPEERVPPPPFGLQDDYPAPYRLRMGGGPQVTIHRPAGGYSPVVLPTIAVDEGTWPVPPAALLAPTRYLPPDEVVLIPPPPPFFADDGAAPPMGWRVLAPQWVPWVYWEASETWPQPPAVQTGRGSGRSHLFLGQIDTPASPASAAGALYVLSTGYGHAAGADQPLLLETPDVAPLGPQARLRLRRIVVPFQYDAACTLVVTPIVDYNTALAPVTLTHDAPSRVTRAYIQMKVLATCTTVRLRVEVTSRAGRVELYTASLYFDPLSGGSPLAMGGTP